MYKVKAKARVTVSLELKLPQWYNWDENIEQLDKRARASAIKILGDGLSEQDWKVLGDPQVTSIITRRGIPRGRDFSG